MPKALPLRKVGLQLNFLAPNITAQGMCTGIGMHAGSELLPSSAADKRAEYDSKIHATATRIP